MELTGDMHAILEAAVRAGEISLIGAARVVETQQAARSALCGLVERGHLREIPKGHLHAGVVRTPRSTAGNAAEKAAVQ